MERLVKKIINKCTRKCLGKQFMRVTTREFKILRKSGGEIIFKNIKEPDHTYHSVLAFKDSDHVTLFFDTITKEAIR